VKALQIAHRAVLVSHALLLATVILWQVLARPDATGLSLAAIFSVPLLLPWRGLLRGKRYTHAWSTLCVMPYLVLGLVESIANPGGRLWSGACLALSLAFFIAVILYLRISRPPAVPSAPH
jgi:uncharacterized membrane protein